MIFITGNQKKFTSPRLVRPVMGKSAMDLAKRTVKLPIAAAVCEGPTAAECLSAQRTFEISFNYQKKDCRTKVLGVTYHSGASIYKVVLSSSISPGSCVFWLQYQEEGWSVVLGTDTDAKLISVIIQAIAATLFSGHRL